ncbi:MAG: DUF6261 family protein [Prevotellaceae bacterium]|jgi:hypothetical protein|nr:DUF6261 family protein [Prevotellaceae bacterium]
MKIVRLRVGKLRSESHFHVFSNVKTLLEEYSGISEILAPQLADFLKLLTFEEKMVDMVKSFDYTKEIMEINYRLVGYISCINQTVVSELCRLDPETVNAAQSIKIRMNSYGGTVVRRTYEEESVAVKLLVTDLQTTYEEQVKLLALDKLIPEIAIAQKNFERILALSYDAWQALPHKKLREMREEIDNIYRAMVRIVNDYVMQHSDPCAEEFVARLNEIILYYNAHARYHCKKNIGMAVVSTIPDQKYSGKPAVFIPSVTYADKELIFPVEYKRSYKNNDKVGTATLIIYGRGAFTGKKIVNFNIV